MEGEAVVAYNTRGSSNKGYQLLQGGLAAEIFHIQPLAYTTSGRHVGFSTHDHDTNAPRDIALRDPTKPFGVPLLCWPRAAWGEHHVWLATPCTTAHSVRKGRAITLRDPKIRPRRMLVRIKTEPLVLMTRDVIKFVFDQIDRTKNVMNSGILANAPGVEETERRSFVSNTLRNSGELQEQCGSRGAVKGIGHIELTLSERLGE
jgi:hypothetical protein